MFFATKFWSLAIHAIHAKMRRSFPPKEACSMQRIILGAATILSVTGTSSATTYFADAAAGSDAAAGTLSQPFKTLGKCLSSLTSAGDICELRGGTYSAVTTDPGTMPSGGVGNPIMIQGHGNEHVV